MNPMALKAKIILLIVILLSLAVYLVYLGLSFPYLGILAEADNKGVWKITKVDHISWAKTNGITEGDIVSSVNHKDPETFPMLKKYHVIEGARDFQLIRNGSKVNFTVSQAFIPELIIYHTIVPLSLFIIFLVFSIFLYEKKGKDQTAIVLILFLLAIGLSYLSAGGSARAHILAIGVNRTTFLLIPVLFLHFLYHYFQSNHIHSFPRQILLSLYCLVGGLIATDLGFHFVSLGESYIVVRAIELCFFAASIGLGLLFLILRYWQYRKTPHKPFLEILTLGIAFAFFPFIGLFALPSALFNIVILPAPIAAIFLLFIPLCFIYLVTANRLLDIDFLIGRLRYYGVLSFFPAAFFIIVLRVLFDTNMKPLQWIQLTCVIYIGLVIFLYMKEELDFRIIPRLFGKKYNFQDSLNRFSHSISKVMKVADLEERMLKEIREVLPVKGISLLEYRRGDPSLDGVNEAGEPRLEWRRGDFSYPEELISGKLSGQPDADNSLIHAGQGVYMIIAEKSGTYYLLWLGDKVNRTKLNQEEIKYLQTLVRHTGILYENLFLIEGLTDEIEVAASKSHSAPPWILRLLFSLSEKERWRLSYDLHDSVLQKQLLWCQKLDTISSDEATTPSSVRERLLEVREGLFEVNHQIREICKQLRPPLMKEHGIVESLRLLFDNDQLRKSCKVNLTAARFAVDLDYEPLLAVYRIVQELLNNTVKHSKADRVDIALSHKGGRVHLHYRDNGIGANLEALQPSFQHMGLSGITERIASLEGEILFRSSAGTGFEASMSFPLSIANKHDVFPR